jgi:hypothetical protein
VAEPGVVRRVIIPFVLMGLTALGLMNTYGDATDVEKLAAETACGGKMCPVRMSEFNRTPFSHDYVYAVGKDGHRVSVKCAREWIFLGDYRCEKK